LIYLKPRTAVPTIDDLFAVLMGLPSSPELGELACLDLEQATQLHVGAVASICQTEVMMPPGEELGSFRYLEANLRHWLHCR
jgi:hypothetical protein